MYCPIILHGTDPTLHARHIVLIFIIVFLFQSLQFFTDFGFVAVRFFISEVPKNMVEFCIKTKTIHGNSVRQFVIIFCLWRGVNRHFANFSIHYSVIFSHKKIDGVVLLSSKFELVSFQAECGHRNLAVIGLLFAGQFCLRGVVGMVLL